MTEQQRQVREKLTEIHRIADTVPGWSTLAGTANENASRVRTLAQALALLAQPGTLAEAWQPIETAPRDGSWVLAHRVSGTNAWSMPECIQWHARVTGGYWQTMEFGWPGRSQEGAGPTHWMPLPSPPTAAAAGSRPPEPPK